MKMASITEKYDALVPTTMEQLIVLADRIAKSNLIPREYVGKPADCLVAMSMGLEIGLKPVQALQSICVINGRPSLWGTAARALVMASGQVKRLTETDPAEVKKNQRARCEIERKGFDEVFIGEFTADDARKAGLLGKDNYQKYQADMFAWRAFHQAARKAFPDIYKGLAAAEELQGSEPFQNGRSEKAQVTLTLDPPPAPQEPEVWSGAEGDEGRHGQPSASTPSTPPANNIASQPTASDAKDDQGPQPQASRAKAPASSTKGQQKLIETPPPPPPERARISEKDAAELTGMAAVFRLSPKKISVVLDSFGVDHFADLYADQVQDVGAAIERAANA